MVHVRFKKPWGLNQAGETQDLDEPIVQILEERQIVERVVRLESAAIERKLERTEIREKPKRKTPK